MKYNLLGMMFLLVVILGACIDDQGNYDYRAESEVLPAMISGLEDKFTFQSGTTHELTAIVEGVEGVKNLRYMWYIYGGDKRDTLGYDKKLDFKVNQESGTYYLWFEVRDTVTDICVDKKIEVTVESFLSTAWLIMKATEGKTDVDAVTADGTLKENLLTSNRQARLGGNPVKIAYVSQHCHEVEKADGKVEKVTKKVFYLISNQELKVFNAENMELLKTTADCFYEIPAVVRPMECNTDGSDVQLINDGKYHYLSTSGSNIGKFSNTKIGPDGTVGYDLYEGALPASQSAMMWDKKSHSFLYAYVYNTQLGYFNEQTAGKVDFGPVTAMKAELKQLMFRFKEYSDELRRYVSMGYGIMEEQGSYYIADIIFDGKNTYPLQGYYKLPADCQIAKSNVLGTHQSSSVIFYACHDELWIHEVNNLPSASQRERKLFTFTGETIACIRHIKKEGDFDYLAVLTNTTNGWKLYAFPFIGGGNEFDTSVEADDVLVVNGKGEAGYFMRMYSGRAY